MAEMSPIDALIGAFPRLFHDKAPRVPSSLPPGWYRLVHGLFVDINSLLNDAEAQTFKVEQIKEKFAGLRVYFRLGAEETLIGDIHVSGSRGVHRINIDPEPASRTFQLIRSRVDQAEKDSLSICEQCGNGGVSIDRSRGWLVTLCAPCRAARSAKSGSAT